MCDCHVSWYRNKPYKGYKQYSGCKGYTTMNSGSLRKAAIIGRGKFCMEHGIMQPKLVGPEYVFMLACIVTICSLVPRLIVYVTLRD